MSPYAGTGHPNRIVEAPPLARARLDELHGGDVKGEDYVFVMPCDGGRKAPRRRESPRRDGRRGAGLPRRLHFGGAEYRTIKAVGKLLPPPAAAQDPPARRARVPSWIESQWPLAHAARRSAELAWQLGIRTCGELVFWSEHCAYVFPY